MQTLIVVAVVAWAAYYVARKVRGIFSGEEHGACEKCSVGDAKEASKASPAPSPALRPAKGRSSP